MILWKISFESFRFWNFNLALYLALFSSKLYWYRKNPFLNCEEGFLREFDILKTDSHVISIRLNISMRISFQAAFHNLYWLTSGTEPVDHFYETLQSEALYIPISLWLFSDHKLREIFIQRPWK